MRKRYLLVPIALLIGLCVYLSVTQEEYSAQPVTTGTEQVVETPKTIQLNADTIFALVNEERSRAGVKPLVRDPELDASAQAKADDMARFSYFAHTNPTTGKHGYEYIRYSKCSYRSENLSQTTGFLDNNTQTVSGWMRSVPHRAAMLDSQYDRTGIAISRGYVVQHFCNT